uniref:Tc1-like transposase DDE domain-containing protein n=1 Tax=Xiphophorus couchianus TaxID=32473 RepID=A0A3B5MU01_9TELE
MSHLPDYIRIICILTYWDKQIKWPALSPDLNHLENLWDKLGHLERAAVQKEWDARPQQAISRLVNNMRRLALTFSVVPYQPLLWDFVSIVFNFDDIFTKLNI